MRQPVLLNPFLCSFPLEFSADEKAEWTIVKLSRCRSHGFSSWYAGSMVMRAFLLSALADDVLLHTVEVVVDRVGGRGRRRRSVHALAQLVLDSSAAGGVKAGRSPASCLGEKSSVINMLPKLGTQNEPGNGPNGERMGLPRTVDMSAMQGFSGCRLGLCTRSVLSGGRRMGRAVPAGMVGERRSGALGRELAVAKGDLGFSMGLAI